MASQDESKDNPMSNEDDASAAITDKAAAASAVDEDEEEEDKVRVEISVVCVWLLPVVNVALVAGPPD